MSIKRKVNKYIDENIKYPNDLQQLKTELNIEKKRGFISMKKKTGLLVTCSILVLALIVGGVLIATNGSKTKEEASLVEISTEKTKEVSLDRKNLAAELSNEENLSIQLTVDKNNKVLSVYGATDEGKMLISGEAIVNKDLDEAVQIIIKLETEYGYLIDGSINANANQINISISSDVNDIVKGLSDDVKASINAACEKYNVQKVINEVEGYALEELRSIAAKCDPTLSEEKLNAMTYKELILVIENYQLEVIDLASIHLEELYQEFKENEIQFATTEEANNFVQNADDAYKIIKSTYLGLCDSVKASVTNIKSSLNQMFIDNFVDPESDYQVALNKVANIKAEVAKLDKDFAAGKITEVKYTTEAAALKISYETFMGALKTAEAVARSVLNALESSLDSAVAALDSFNSNLPEEIKTPLQETLVTFENELNATKDKYMTEFEGEFTTAIEQVRSSVAERKAQIKAILESSK